MNFVEAGLFLEGLNKRNREAWEQTRILGYIIAQANSTKALERTDILNFPWDEPEEETKKETVSDDDMVRLRARAKQIESQLKEENHG